MKRILVTGSKGQLGSELKALSSNYPDFQFIYTDIDELNLTDEKAINTFFEKEDFDFCINCAAYTAVDKAEDEPKIAMLINATTVEYLAKACSKKNIPFIHISTDYVFDGKNHKPYSESDAVSPCSEYGKSKLAGEKATFKYSDTALIIRTSWLYSSYGNNFVKTMLRLGKERKELSVVFDQVGTPTYAGDLAKVILDILSGNIIKPGVSLYHYSNEGVISWYDFAQAIFRESGISCHLKAIESREFPVKATRPFYSVLNKSKIKHDFQLEIPYWLDSLKLVLKQLEN